MSISDCQTTTPRDQLGESKPQKRVIHTSKLDYFEEEDDFSRIVGGSYTEDHRNKGAFKGLK